MQFKTKHSTYEVDWSNRMIRRLDSDHEPTPRQGDDGQWKQFHSIDLMVPGDEGFSFFIDWDGAGHGTLTSEIMEITEDQVATQV